MNGEIMNEQTYWWVANIIGTVTFLALVIDFVIEKRKVPMFVIVLTIFAFIGGAVYGWISFRTIINSLFTSFLWAVLPPIIWFLCGGSVFSTKDRAKTKSESNTWSNTSSETQNKQRH